MSEEERARWMNFAGMMKPISDDCLCFDSPDEKHVDESRRNPDDPSCHQQYCPVYLYAYALALAEGRPMPA